MPQKLHMLKHYIIYFADFIISEIFILLMNILNLLTLSNFDVTQTNSDPKLVV